MEELNRLIILLKGSGVVQLAIIIGGAVVTVLGIFASTTFIVAGVLIIGFGVYGYYAQIKLNKKFDLIKHYAVNDKPKALELLDKMIAVDEGYKESAEFYSHVGDRDDRVQNKISARKLERRLELLEELKLLIERNKV